MSIRKETARHHTVIFTLVRKPNVSDQRMHVLYCLQPSTPPQPVTALIDYFIDMGQMRALAWQRDTARAVGLLVDYLTANAVWLKNKTHSNVLAGFAEALVGGTIDVDGNDRSGLFWEPKAVSRAKRLLRSVTVFSDWLENRYGTRQLNPWRAATVEERIAYWRRLDKRNANALLGYTNYRSAHQARAHIARTVNIQRKTVIAMESETKFFPADRIWDLLLQGFAVPGRQRSPFLYERLSLKDILMTILLHGGGLRESEPLHLYVSDVGIDPDNPKRAVVRLYHPEQGAAPADYIDPLTGKRIDADREEYLRLRWRMQPRNLVEGRFKAGWKDLMLLNPREKYALVHWFPSFWGEVFLAFFKLYITHCRSRHCQHPFLFVSHKDGFNGDPYTVDAFRQKHDRAVKKIGLVPAKALGTTPHGHRHAFGQRLSDAGLDDLTIQRVMHHKSPVSQRVYTGAPAAKVAQALAAAQGRLAVAGQRQHLPSIVLNDASLRKLLEVQ